MIHKRAQPTYERSFWWAAWCCRFKLSTCIIWREYIRRGRAQSGCDGDQTKRLHYVANNSYLRLSSSEHFLFRHVRLVLGGEVGADHTDRQRQDEDSKKRTHARHESTRRRSRVDIPCTYVCAYIRAMLNHSIVFIKYKKSYIRHVKIWKCVAGNSVGMHAYIDPYAYRVNLKILYVCIQPWGKTLIWYACIDGCTCTFKKNL
jgi:hypothetical protein